MPKRSYLQMITGVCWNTSFGTGETCGLPMAFLAILPFSRHGVRVVKENTLVNLRLRPLFHSGLRWHCHGIYVGGFANGVSEEIEVRHVPELTLKRAIDTYAVRSSRTA